MMYTHAEDKIIPKNAAFFLGTLCISLDLELYHIFYQQCQNGSSAHRFLYSQFGITFPLKLASYRNLSIDLQSR